MGKCWSKCMDVDGNGEVTADEVLTTIGNGFKMLTSATAEANKIVKILNASGVDTKGAGDILQTIGDISKTAEGTTASLKKIKIPTSKADIGDLDADGDIDGADMTIYLSRQLSAYVGQASDIVGALQRGGVDVGGANVSLERVKGIITALQEDTTRTKLTLQQVTAAAAATSLEAVVLEEAKTTEPTATKTTTTAPAL